ncbi:MAG: YihY/virulence factor BrkB family protein [Alphaproteobacteria bacterium]
MIQATCEIVSEAYAGLRDADGLALAGNIAFCMILALFPFLILLTALAGFFGNEALAQTVVDYLLSVMPEELASPVAPEIHYILTAQRTDLLTLSVALTLWTASGAVESIRVGLNRAYGFTERRPFWLRFVQNVAFVIGGAVVLLVLATSIVFGPVLWAKAVHFFPAIDRFSTWFHLLRYPVSLTLMATALISAHLFLPVRRHPLRELWPGIALTMVLWLGAALGYAEYLSNFSTIAIMYAGLTGIIIALIFLYLSGALLIWGGQINQALISRRRSSARY